MAKGSRHVSKPLIPVSTASQISDEDRKLFTPEELKALEEEVTNEVMMDLQEEARTRVRERLKTQKRAEMQRRLNPAEQLCYFTVDLAPFADRITLDGVVYFHGATYEVPSRQYDTMREIAARTWNHEASIGNANSQFYQKPRNIRLGPKDASASASQLMRV